MQYKKICPACYRASGFSVPMTKEGEVWQCTKDHMHRFKENKDGFLDKV